MLNICCPVLELFGVANSQAITIVLGIIAITSAISVLSGLWGVLVTDLFQFFVKMTHGHRPRRSRESRPSVSIDQMKLKLAAIDHAKPPPPVPQAQPSASPQTSTPSGCPLITFLVYISVQMVGLLATPALNPAAAASIAQPMFSAKDEKKFPPWRPSGSTSPITPSARGHGS